MQKQILDKAEDEGTSVEKATANLPGAKQPNKRFIRPESLKELIALLCADHGEAMTGEIFAVDCGWTAQ